AGRGRGATPLRRNIFDLPGIRMVLTDATLTLNNSSTARLISILFASNATLKVYLFCSCSFTDFSVTTPWRSTSVISTVFSSSPRLLRYQLRLTPRRYRPPLRHPSPLKHYRSVLRHPSPLTPKHYRSALRHPSPLKHY